MAKSPVRPAFLAAALAVAAVVAFVLVFVLSKKDFWAELNLFFWVVTGGWFLTLWAFLFFGWGLRGPDPSVGGWAPRLQDPGWIVELLGHLPSGGLDLGGDDLVGVLVGLVGTILFLAVLVLLWGVAELVIFAVVALVFLLVNKGFRAQVVRNRRCRGKPLRSLGMSAYLTAASVGWLPVVTLAYRLVFR